MQSTKYLRTGAFILASVIYIFSSAQNTVKVMGQFVGSKPENIQAVTFKGTNLAEVSQSMEVSAFNSFAGNLLVKESGICVLMFKDFAYHFILGPEPFLRFRIVIQDGGQMSVWVDDSRENDAYLFTKILMNDQNRMYSYFSSCELDSCAYMMRKEQDVYRHNRDSICALFPGTYSADVLCRFFDFHAPNKGNLLPAVMKSEILTETPWYLAEAYNGKIINHCVQLYLDYGIDTGIFLRRSILALLGKTIQGSQSRNRLCNVLFDIFADYVEEDGLTQFLDLEASEPDLFSDQVLKEKCRRMQKVMPGRKAPEILLPDTSGSEVSLLGTAAENKFTLLFIWNPDCSHCIAGLQTLKEVYNKYRTKGLEIFSVALEENEKAWRRAISKSNPGWKNVHITDDGKSQPEEYFVTYLPSLILINQQGNIVKRRLPVEELEHSMAEFYKLK